MPEFTLTDTDSTRIIDLGNSRELGVLNLASGVKVFIDYDVNGTFTSAIKGSAGFANPFVLGPGDAKIVAKSDLESEHVRVGIDGDGAKVRFSF